MTDGRKQRSADSATAATQGAETPARDPRPTQGVEACVWTERMLSALVNGVEGGKWYALIDKVYAPKTLQAAWTRVQRNNGAAGTDRQSTGRFAAKADLYLWRDNLGETGGGDRDGMRRPSAM